MDYPWRDLWLGALQRSSHQEFQTGPTGNETLVATSVILRAIDDLYQKVCISFFPYRMAGNFRQC